MSTKHFVPGTRVRLSHPGTDNSEPWEVWGNLLRVEQRWDLQPVFPADPSVDYIAGPTRHILHVEPTNGDYDLSRNLGPAEIKTGCEPERFRGIIIAASNGVISFEVENENK